MRGIRSICAFVWFLLALDINAELSANRIAHAYERMWLYEMYELFCDADGVYGNGKDVPKWQQGLPRQVKIFGCWASQFQKSATPNKGSGPNGRLTFAEFNWRCNKKNVPNEGIPKDLPTDEEYKDWMEGKNGRSPMDVVNALAKNNMVEPMKLEENGIVKDNFKEFLRTNTDSMRSPFMLLMEQCEAEYTKIRLDPKRSARITPEKRNRIQHLENSIISMRKQDNEVYLTRFLKGVPGVKDGLLPKVITTKTTSELQNHPDYDKIDLERTWDEVYGPDPNNRLDILLWTRRKTAAKARKYLFAYVEKNGDEDVGIDFPDSSIIHRRVIIMWEKFLKNSKTPVEKLACDS